MAAVLTEFIKLGLGTLLLLLNRYCAQLVRYDLLILDDWAVHPLSLDESRDLLEILDDRYQVQATLIASQVP